MPVKPLIIAFVALSCWSGLARGAPACSDLPSDTATVRLAGLDAAGDPILADGRSLRLVGLAPRQDTAEAARFAAEIARWRDIDLHFVGLGATDRWGRQPARLLVPSEAGADARDLAMLLIAAGAGTPLPEATATGCGAAARLAKRAPKRGTPQTALAQALAQPGPLALDGHDIAALKAHAGRLVAIEGRIASVGERSQRTYLNFSRQRAAAGSIMMPKKVWREMQDAGWTASRLSGKRVRARGVLSGQDGLLLDVTSALALDLID